MYIRLLHIIIHHIYMDINYLYNNIDTLYILAGKY